MVTSVTVNNVYRDYVTPGVPGSGNHEIDKADARALHSRLETMAGIGAVAFATKAELDAVVDKDDATPGFVLGDSTATNNGQYAWDDTGGSWVKLRALPDTAAVLQSVSGTNTITASVGTGVDPAVVSIFVLTAAATNTGAVTLNISGGGAQDLVDRNGDALVSGSLVSGRSYLLFDDGSDYRLLNDDDRILPYQGAYAGGTTYELGDLVESGGSIWYSLQDSNTGNTPSEGAYWTEFMAGASPADNTITNAKLTSAHSLALSHAVASRTVLKALDATRYNVAYLQESGREGVFGWDGSDLSSILLGSAVSSSAVDSGTEEITSTGHGLSTGDPVITTTGVNGLSTNTIYYVIRVDADTFQLASSFANAAAGTAFNLTGTTAITVKRHYDSLEGAYVPPSSDITGASGAWVRGGYDLVNVKWCGASGDGVADDTAAFNCALDLGKVLVPNGLYLIDPTISILVNTSGRKIIGEAKRGSALLAKYNTAGSVIKRTFDTGSTNDRVDDVTIENIQIFLNHIHQSAVPANIQIAFDMRNIGRTTIKQCYAGNYRYGLAATLYANAADKTQAMRGYGFVYGNVGASDPAYAGGEVHTNEQCQGWWLRKSHVIDDATLSPVSAAYVTHISDADIQTVERGIAQESQYNTGCTFSNNLIQDVKQAASGSDTRHSYYVGGYENRIYGGYNEVVSADIDSLIYFASTARNNVVEPMYHTASHSKVLDDNGSRNLVKYYYSREVTITGATQANPCVITATGHNLRNGDKIEISSVSGMTELNGNTYTISNLTATTFELNVDSSAFTAYTSGGTGAVVDKTLADFYYNAPLESSVKFNWDGSAILAIGDLASASNITRNGVGDYTLTFDDAFANDDYDISVTLDTNASGHLGGYTVGSHGTTTLRIYTYAQNGATSTQIDPRNVWVTVRQIMS